MSRILLLNKPFQVLSQFTDKENRNTLAQYIPDKNCYPAGRLDYDSEGLLLLTDDGVLQARIADPKFKLPKAYWVQVEGAISDDALTRLSQGIMLKDGKTRPAKARRMEKPDIWRRNPPVRQRNNDITSWIELTITEGRNRQVRRMTAAVGHPTLRLIRYSIGNWNLGSLQPGQYREEQVHLPEKSNYRHSSNRSKTGTTANRKYHRSKKS